LKKYIMKNILYLLSLLCILAVVPGCEDEDRIRIPEFQTGANLRVVIDPAHSVINSTSVATDFVAFTAYSENKDLDNVEIQIHYKNQVHVFGVYTQDDFADGQISGQFNGADLAGWFGVPGFADGSRGGNFTIRPKVTLDDGRIYPSFVHLSATDSIRNLGTGITGNNNTGAFTVQAPTAILCPPVNISGNYTVVSSSGTSTDGCCPGVVTVSGNTVAVTSVAGSVTNFRLSDITGGLYFEWYDVYGITSPNQSPGFLLFNCNEVNVVNTVEPFGTAVQGEGLYDEDTGTLTYTWSNGFADQGTVVLQKQ
jgi:hypothetical protein